MNNQQNTIREEKQRIRMAMREQQRALSAKYIERASTEINARLMSLPEYRAAKTVFCFVGTSREPHTLPFLERALAQGKRVCVPLCLRPGEMEARQIERISDLAPGRYGILEPPLFAPRICAEEIDFAAIPCLACTRSGDRLGKGGGFYDRFLAEYSHARVLLCLDKLIMDEIPMEAHDRVVAPVLSERGLYGVAKEAAAAQRAQAPPCFCSCKEGRSENPDPRRQRRENA